jgi:hypothetical protein
VLLIGSIGARAQALDLTGTWKFSVDLENGEHGEPVFTLKQTDHRLTGTYEGPFGKQQVTGTVSGETVTLEVGAHGFGKTLKLSYTGKVEGSEKPGGTIDRMSGTMSRVISGASTPGTWTATRRH